MSANTEFSSVEQALAHSMRKRVLASLGASGDGAPVDEYASLLAELLAWDVMTATGELSAEGRAKARDAFVLLRESADAHARDTQFAWHLRVGCLAVLADVPQEGRKALADVDVAVQVKPSDWLAYARASVNSSWLALLRHSSNADMAHVSSTIGSLRSLQRRYEGPFLKSLKEDVKATAIELMGLYFLGTAAERLAQYLVLGKADGGADIDAQLDMYFERLQHVWERGVLPPDADVAYLLHITARELVAGSIRAATRGANSLTRRFADSLVSRPSNPLFQLLPPQREALRRQGLASNVHRSIVVNFPTSSGKTLLAQFNILQALNDLGGDRGWVAYVAPTRALVNQVTRRLRQDFQSLGKRVERLSPALEFDSIELSAITPSDVKRDGPPVDVLVCTPEKLDLLVRRDELCASLGRLALVVVDEAHNIGANDERAIKLELLLAVINREHTAARFMLLTPFIRNARGIAQWLDKADYKDYSIDAHWVPNDRIIGIAEAQHREPGDNGRKLSKLYFTPVQTSRHTLHLDEKLVLDGIDAALGLTVAQAHANGTKLSGATAHLLSSRGSTVLLARTVRDTWTAAEFLKKAPKVPLDGAATREIVASFVEYELGSTSPLPELIRAGLAVHHAGLPEEVAQAIECLFEKRWLHTLCATTTLAQGVNFPIANLVISSIYPVGLYGEAMPYADFWNIAGRVGRVDQDAVGVVALVAKDSEQSQLCKQFLERSMKDLVSRLVEMVQELGELSSGEGLSALVYRKQWSAFSQFIAHTLRQVGLARFTDQVELVLRGSLGYQTLRETNLPAAKNLLSKTRQYAEHIARDMGSVALVDSTGFSFESVRAALGKLSQLGGMDDLLKPDALFSGRSQTLRDVMGVLMQIPEVRDDLVEIEGKPGGRRIADMLVDWVKGESIEKLAGKYFSDKDDAEALTECVRSFKRLSMTSAWGLSSVLAMKFGAKLDELPEQAKQAAMNIPSMVLYGVWSSEQIALRSAGVPRNATFGLAKQIEGVATPYMLRQTLAKGGEKLWQRALGEKKGRDYYKVWLMLEG